MSRAYSSLGDFLKEKIEGCGKPKSQIAGEVGIRPETVSRLIALDNNSIQKDLLAPLAEHIGLDIDDRILFYQLAGAVLPEIQEAFCDNTSKAVRMTAIATEKDTG